VILRPDTSPLGDSAITIRFGTEKSSELLQRIHGAASQLRRLNLPHVEDIVPAYLTITIFYDALATTYEELRSDVIGALDILETNRITTSPREHVIPVRYSGPDLSFVASQCRLSVDDVIAIHSAVSYTVDILGFVPGFAYLSELDARIQLPRRSEPRTRVPAGSVAIAGGHTGVYPLDTPGGWHILGTTEIRMFDITRDQPALFAAGDVVRFVRIE
jgi:KipI family sensor histidine kinase inhibitor